VGCGFLWTSLKNLTDLAAVNYEDIGPMQEYDARVDHGILRNDEHQRGAYVQPAAVDHKWPSACERRQGG